MKGILLLSAESKAVPSRTIWRRPLMVRQPYSVAVPSTGGRLHPGIGSPLTRGTEGRKDY